LEKEANYYDAIFEHDTMFHTEYKDSVYYVPWTQVIVFLRRFKKNFGEVCILEIGSGPGQLTQYLFDEGFTNYHGFDFSTKAIELAKIKFPKADFYLGNALDSTSFQKEYNTAICLEVLEHVIKDICILENIKIGTHVIFSVPNFDADSHVRWFTSERQIKRRYYRFINIDQIKKVGNIYVCSGIRENFAPTIFQRLLITREEVHLASFINRLKHHLKNILKTKWL
jgi:2-polyprenyl-3-methyl-5-hydroxy-6-metoxy-1,4-benzoquinol methylase